MAACGGPSDPPAAPAGFFPSGFEAGPLVSSATMVKSSAVGPHTTSFHFHVSVPRDEAFVVVVRCDTGKATVEAGGLMGGPCEGKPTGFTNGECGGYHAS